MMEDNRVLITGASGLLGANLVRHMHQLGFPIRVLVRPGADLSALQDIPMEVHYGYIDQEPSVLQAVSGCRYVVHAASLTSQWGTAYEAYKSVNITATRYIAEACLKHDIRKLIYIGTANTLAPGSKEMPGTELNAFGLHHINSGYINSKYVALQYIQEQVQQKGLPAAIISPTFMIGPYDLKPSSGQLLLHGLKQRYIAFPSGGKNFVHVQDVCKGIVNALDMARPGAHYLLAGENLSYKEFFQEIDRQMARKRSMIRIPGRLLRGLGRMGSLIQQVSGRPVRLNYAAAYMLSLDNYYSGAKAARELQIDYQGIDQAIADALDWFRRQQYC